jgi:hypothetical protein
MILIIGTGRSGTHWLAKILAKSGQIRVTFEPPKIFNHIMRASLGQMDCLSEIVQLYRNEIKQTKKEGFIEYADKSNPALWIAESLLLEIPKLRFIGIERSVYAYVASALKHGGMAYWVKQWRKFPIPNKFLGITKKLADKYDDLSLTQKLTMRWCENHHEMKRLKLIIGERLHFVKYEDLIQSPEYERDRLVKFLGLKISVIKPQVKSLDKWRSELSKSQIIEINDILSKYQIGGAF